MIFGDTPAKEYAQVVKFVRTTLKQLGYDPAAAVVSEDQDESRFRIEKGSAVVFISVIHQERQNVLRLVAPIVAVGPQEGGKSGGLADPAKLHRRLLELNLSTLYQCAFAIDAQGDVVVTSDRICTDIDLAEVKSLIDVIAFFADEYDDLLVSEFGGRRWGEPPPG